MIKMFTDIDVSIHGEDIDYNDSVTYEEIGKCPLCHVALHPDVLTATLYDDHLYMIASCPSCEGAFFLTYFQDRNIFYLEDVTPKKIESADLPHSIKSLSPKFSDIFSQAENAEEQGLSEICGLGYRRALEFLVKDYLCHADPEHVNEIKEQTLSTCIKNRIKDERIKTLAERATWIGNDETHYIRKHEDLDIQDMKRFICAMEAYIDAEFAFEDALKIEPKK